MGAFIRALSAGKDKILQYLSSNPAAASRIASKVGAGAGATPGKLIQLAKDNPLTAAFLAFEIGEAGLDLVEALRESHPEMISQLEQLSYKNDTVRPETSISDIDQFADELEIIDNVAARLGGDAALYDLVNFIDMISKNRNILVLREKLQMVQGRR